MTLTHTTHTHTHTHTHTAIKPQAGTAAKEGEEEAVEGYERDRKDLKAEQAHIVSVS
jgi:hypothetical protein